MQFWLELLILLRRDKLVYWVCAGITFIAVCFPGMDLWQAGDDRLTLHKCTAVKLPEVWQWQREKRLQLKWSQRFQHRAWCCKKALSCIPSPLLHLPSPIAPHFFNVMSCFHPNKYPPLPLFSSLLESWSSWSESLEPKGLLKGCQEYKYMRNHVSNNLYPLIKLCVSTI